MKILAVRLSAIGDIVHTMPTIVAIKRAHPDSVVHWAISDKFRDTIEGHRSVDKVIEVKRHASLSQYLELRKLLRAEHYDVALDMQGLLKSAAVVALSGAKKKLGFYLQREGSWMFSKGVKPEREGLHVVEQYLAVAKALGCEPFPVDFNLHPMDDALATARTKLDSLALSGRPLAINLSAGRAWKQWPPKRFAEFVPMAEGLGWAPFLIGAEADKPIEDEYRAIAQKPIPSLVGKTSLPVLTAVLSLVDAHVAGDTGSIHIATALGKPVVCMMPVSLNKSGVERCGPYKRQAFTIGNNNLSEISAQSVADLLAKL